MFCSCLHIANCTLPGNQLASRCAQWGFTKRYRSLPVLFQGKVKIGNPLSRVQHVQSWTACSHIIVVTGKITRNVDSCKNNGNKPNLNHCNTAYSYHMFTHKQLVLTVVCDLRFITTPTGRRFAAVRYKSFKRRISRNNLWVEPEKGA